MAKEAVSPRDHGFSHACDGALAVYQYRYPATF